MGVNGAFFSKFKKVMALIGSDRDGERHAAADQAFRMCQQNDVSFFDAMDGAFGGSGDELHRAEEKITELEDDNRRMAEAVAAMRDELGNGVPDDAGRKLAAKLMAYPSGRLIALLLYFIVRLWVVVFFIHDVSHSGQLMHFVLLMLDAGSIGGLGAMFRFWAEAEFSKNGVGVVAMKTAVIVFGFYMALSGLYGTGYVRSWIWATNTWYDNAWPWVAFIASLTLPNIIPWLCRQLAHSRQEPFATLRSWFA